MIAQPKASDQIRSFARRWAPELEADGHTQISIYFLENYHRLKPYPLTHSEAMFVIHLMQYKWDERSPYPGYKTIAQRMGVATKSARRYAQSLQQKKCLHREVRIGQTNLFDLAPLMKALVAHKAQASPKKPRRKESGVKKKSSA